MSEVIADFGKAIATDVGNEVVYYGREKVRFDLENGPAAISDSSEATRLGPDWALHHHVGAAFDPLVQPLEQVSPSPSS